MKKHLNPKAGEMRVRLRTALLSGLALLGLHGAAQAAPVEVQTPRGLAQAEAGELLVKFSGSTATAASTPNSLTAIRNSIHTLRLAAAPVNQKIGATELKSFGSIGWQLVKLPVGMSLADGMKFYNAQPGVAGVEVNSLRYLKAVPNDPSYGQQYGLAKIGAPAAWNKSKGSSGVIVAVIDSGVNYTHEDLAANMWKNPKEIPGNGKDDDGNGYIDDVYGYDMGDADSDPMDANHHGSHCAGIIGAAGNNGIGGSGVNWNSNIMACKVMKADGTIPTSAIMEAIQYVITMKARGNNIRVISESLGGPTFNQAEHDLIGAAGNAGILLAAAAGNETNDNDAKASYPASYDCPNIIAVAASDADDQVADFSNYGATTVDLAAPGVDIYSTFWPGNNAYSNLSGTSMATPMVAGAAALLCAFSPSQTPATLKKTLMDTVDIFPQWEGKVVSGGRMNLARALQTLDPNGLPTVNSVSPRSLANNLKPAITVNFSKAMNPASVQANFSVAPAVPGTFAWTNANQTLTYTPAANLTSGSAYQVRIKGEALSAAGIKLDGDLSQTSTGSPTDDYAWTFRIAGAPSNDNFAKAMPLTGDSGFVPSHNFGATREAGEPGHGNYFGNGDKSVWFKWTAPSDGNIVFSTNGSTLNNCLAGYTGTAVGALTNQEEAESVDKGAIIEFRATAGVTYSIAVDGMFYPQTETTPAFTDTGNIALSWTFYRSPTNDYFNSAQSISGTSGSVTGNTLGAYSENGEGNHIGRDSSVWYKWIAPANGAVTFDTTGSAFDTTLTSFTGSSVAGAVEAAHDNDGGGNGRSQLPFTVRSGVTYYVTVGGAGYAFTDGRGDFKLNWKFVTAPTNDNFAAATALSPAPVGSTSVSTYGATLESNEPQVLYRDGVASVWYSWTAPGNGALTLSTGGSSFDTNLAVYTGGALSTLTAIDQNDDDDSASGATTSKIKFTAVSGTKYWVRIDSPAYASPEASIGYPATHGTAKLSWTFQAAPSNDLFANAQLLPGSNGSVVGTSVGANLQNGEPTPQYRDYGASIWYKWVAPTDGAVTFDTAGSTLTNGNLMDTYLSIYTGAQLEGLQDAAYNDDDQLNAPTPSSRVRFTVAAGTTYYLRIDGNPYTFTDSGKNYDATHGTVVLGWSFSGAPSNDRFANAINLTPVNSGRVTGTTVGASTETGEEIPTFRDQGYSIWYKWTAPADGPVTFSTAGSLNGLGTAYDTYLSVYTGTQVDNLDWQDGNGDDGSLPTSKSSIDAQSGVTYYIRVDNQAYNEGDSVTDFLTTHGQINLSWSFNGAPINGPVISSFSPPSGGAGTTVTLKGTNLDGATAVTFDGISAPISSVSATSVVVTAPTDVHTGKIILASPKGSAASPTDFLVAPVINSFTPGSGAAGTTVVISGRAFYGVQKVTFGDVSAQFTPNSTTQLTAKVPAAAVTGKISVTTAGGTALSATNFGLTPSVSGFTPASGPAGTHVLISGANFTGTTAVLFNGVKSASLIVNPTSVDAVVPTAATTGLISVVTPYGTALSATNFTVTRLPTITGFTPGSGKSGMAVVISGTNFTGATAVRFNGVAVTSPTIGATSITAVVPAGATTGPISVITPDGQAQSATNFIVDNEVPAVAITTPTVNQSLSTAAFTTISGTATDNLGVSQVILKLTRVRGGITAAWNGSAFSTTQVFLDATLATPSAKSTAWSYAVSPALKAALDEGAYTVYAFARDAASNQSAVQVVNFTLSLDAQKPVVAITAPTANQSLPVASYSGISGTATDDIGVTQLHLTLSRLRAGVTTYWNGTSFTTAQTTLSGALATAGAKSTTWSYPTSAALNAALDNGAYTVTAFARDASGKPSDTQSRSFVLTDTEKPVAAITAPTPGQNLPAASFSSTSGTATDNVGVSQVLVRLFRVRSGVTTYWNGTAFVTSSTVVTAQLATVGVKSTNWNYTVPPALKAALDTGGYSINVFVRDLAGNQGDIQARSFAITATSVKPAALPEVSSHDS